MYFFKIILGHLLMGCGGMDGWMDGWTGLCPVKGSKVFEQGGLCLLCMHEREAKQRRCTPSLEEYIT